MHFAVFRLQIAHTLQGQVSDIFALHIVCNLQNSPCMAGGSYLENIVLVGPATLVAQGPIKSASLVSVFICLFIYLFI